MPSDHGTPQLFDRRAVRLHRERAAAGLAEHDFLLRAVGQGLLERLTETTRHFPLALDLGCHDGTLAKLLAERDDSALPAGAIGTLIQADSAPAMVRAAAGHGGPALVADEEWLPIGPGKLDLVISLFALHWVNDLPGVLAQIRYALKPGGLFLAALPGGISLAVLRDTLMEAEAATSGGVSPRVSPFVEVREAGMLLQRVGFQLPMADADSIPIDYGDPLTALRDLRGMGEANALQQRRRGALRRDTFAQALQAYPRRADGRLVAEVEVLYLTGWAPE
ncbi:MAG: methyltransferase domain-containing protein [Pseudomonadota bacterium]